MGCTTYQRHHVQGGYVVRQGAVRVLGVEVPPAQLAEGDCSVAGMPGDVHLLLRLPENNNNELKKQLNFLSPVSGTESTNAQGPPR